MSVLVFDQVALGLVAYLTDCDEADLEQIHASTVLEFQHWYAGRHACPLFDRDDIAREAAKHTSSTITDATVKEVSDVVSLLRYNAGTEAETLAALDRVEAAAFRLLRLYMLRDIQWLRALRVGQEYERTMGSAGERQGDHER